MYPAFRTLTLRVQPRRHLTVILSSSLVYGAIMIGVQCFANDQFPWCDHPARCFDYATELRGSINKKVDPCYNFYDHVCGNWASLHPGKKDQLKLLGLRTRLWLMQALEQRPLSSSSSAVDKVIVGYQKCMSVVAATEDQAEPIRKVFREFYFDWPSLALPTQFNLLDFLVGLALDFGIYVVFRMGFAPHAETNKGYSLYILPIDKTSSVTSAEKESMASCIRSFNPTAHVDASRVFEMVQAASIEFRAMALLAPEYHIDDYPRYLRLRDFAVYERNSSNTIDLMASINNRMPASRQLGSEAPILVQSFSPLTLVELIIKKYKNRIEDIMLFFGWKVVRVMAHTFSFTCSASTIVDAMLHKSTECMNTMASLAPYAMSYLLYKDLVHPGVASYTEVLANNIRETMMRSFQSLSWMDKLTLEAALDRMTSIIGIYGTPPRLADKVVLDSYYKYLPLFDKIFSGDLLEALRMKSSRLKEYLGTDPQHVVRREDVEMPLLDANAFYLPHLHMVFIETPLLQLPFVDLALPAAVNYGTMGRVIGHELSHAFGPSASWLSRRSDVLPLYSNQSKQAFDNRLSCLVEQVIQNSGSRPLGLNSIEESFADSAGLEKAYLAYQRLPEEPSQFGYTQEQLFFVSGCFGFCSMDGLAVAWNQLHLPPKLRCNTPVMNLRQFGRAFGCTQEARLEVDDQGSGVHASADLSPMANTGGQVDPGIPVLGRWAVGACEAFVIQLYQVLRMALAIFHSVFNAPKICPGTVTESVTTVNATDELPCSPLHGSQSWTISAGPKKKERVSVSAYLRHSDDSSAEPSKLVLRLFLPFFITFESLVDVVSVSKYQPLVTNSSTGVDIVFPTLMFADQVELNLTLAVDPENKRGYGMGETLATIPYRAICDQSSRGSQKQAQGAACGNMSHVLFTVNSNGEI
ncbi:neprilysin-11-like [Ixodes scapularis]